MMLNTQTPMPSSKKEAEGQNAAEAERSVTVTTEVTAQKATEPHNGVPKVGEGDIHDRRGVEGDG